MKFYAIALALVLAANDAQAQCTIPAIGTAAAATAATCVKKTGGTTADGTACGLVTALDTSTACAAVALSTSLCSEKAGRTLVWASGGATNAVNTVTVTGDVNGLVGKTVSATGITSSQTVASVSGQTITLSANVDSVVSGDLTIGTTVPADVTLCAAVTALNSATACEAVAITGTATTAACHYTASTAACDYTVGTSARKTAAGTCTVGANTLASGASCDLAMASGYAGTGTTTYTCPRGTCTVQVANLFGAAATADQIVDNTNCNAVTALDSNTVCHSVELKATGTGQACIWTAPTQFTATPTLKATGCAAGAWQNGGTDAATVTCSSCGSGKSFAAAAAGALNAATPCTANCPANFYQANNKLATCTKKVIAGTCAAKSITVARVSGGGASSATFVVSAADIAKVKVGMKAVSAGITAATTTIASFVVATKTITLSANVNAALLAAEVVTLTVPGDTTACTAVAASATSTACDAVVQTTGACAAKVTTVVADVQSCAAVSGGTKIACEEIMVALEQSQTDPKTGGSACTYTAPTATACTHTAATSIAADVTACAAVTAAENAAATTVCSAVSVAAGAALACDYAAASAALTCAACATGKTLAANTKILDSAQTAADCVGAASTAAASSAVSATASVTTAVAAALAAAAVLV